MENKLFTEVNRAVSVARAARPAETGMLRLVRRQAPAEGPEDRQDESIWTVNLRWKQIQGSRPGVGVVLL